MEAVINVWFAIPSARPPAEANEHLQKWRDMGYRLALLRQGEPIEADLLIPAVKYCGWAPSVNLLAKRILQIDPAAEWIVSGGDDYEPDGNQLPHEIAQSCTEHFGGTFGVMQPTGDRWGEDPTAAQISMRGAYIDRIAGSPWMGREWCQRAYGGNGPMWGEYFHMYGDEELQAVAKKLGVFWQRRDLTQKHCHWGRTHGKREIPKFLQPVNSPQHWKDSSTLFNRRKAAGFPGHQPCR